MTLTEAYEKRRLEVLDLQKQVKTLQKQLEQASSGLFVPSEKAALLKQINHLTQQVKTAEHDRDHYRDLCNTARNRTMFHDFKKLDLEEENEALANENSLLKKEMAYLRDEIDTLNHDREHLRLENISLKRKRDQLMEELSSLKKYGAEESAAKIAALSDEVARLTAIINDDGTHSGIPSSKTPVGKNKLIPNSREKTGLKKGGQPGHTQHTLASVPDDEVTDTEDHPLGSCPYCGGELEEIGCDHKDELDYEVKVIKRRHRYPWYRCKNCGKESRARVENRLKEKCQYGNTLQAMTLALLDLGFVSVNRIKKLIRGFSSGELDPSEAYIIGLQKKAARKLDLFAADVKRALAAEIVLYWDDTVVFINKMRSCMRFYGTEKLALFTAHAGKGRDGLDDDGLLAMLSSMTFVMHDHNTVNYNADFIFANIECNQHLQRDLQKLAEISKHKWASELKDLISNTIHNRKQWQKEGKTAFTDAYINAFENRINELLAQGIREHEADQSRYYEDDERRLLNRLRKYRSNYFMWVKDFRLPATNNLSERSLRFTKVHEKVSGQFESVEYAKYFAKIRTYLETCARNGINEFTALLRLTEDNPFSFSEVLSYSGS